MPDLPTGTVTFLLTDIEGSTPLLQRLGGRYADVLAEHQRLMRDALHRAGGHVVDTQGDAFFVAFERASDALAAALALQRQHAHHPWPDGVAVRVRMGIHTGEPIVAGGRYVGLDVHAAARIAAAGHGGQILLSDTTAALIEHDRPPEVSLRDLGRHRLKDLAGPVRLYQVDAPGLAQDFAPLRSLDARPHNLPVQLTSFVGREDNLREVRTLLDGARLLTLTGAGGSGKTRLALRVAADALERFSDGVWLVELAPLSDPTAVPRDLASVLGVREQHDRPLLGVLSAYLEGKTLLLVLDNCEHLLDACADLSRALLQAAPTLRILATSREHLGVPGEVTYRVPTLRVPPDGPQVSANGVLEYEAARLFTERAQAALPSFRVTGDTARVVADIVRQLDGIPLAIEFAAARVRALSVEQIAARLGDRLGLRAGSTRGSLPRHETLRATLDWSHDLLSDAERAVLRRLGVFVGGATLEATEAICAGAGVASAEILDVLTRLVDKSLVTTEEGERAFRYRLLETVREYALERLADGGETDETRRCHRDYFLDAAERAEPQLHGPDQVAWLDRLEADHDNLRAALKWSLGQAGDHGGVRLAGAQWWYWAVRGHLIEGREWLESALRSAADVPVPLRIKALTGAGALASAGDDFARAVGLLREAVALARAAGERHALAVGLSLLGHATWHSGDPQAGVALAAESFALSHELGDAWAMARSSYDVAIVAWHVEDYDRMAAVAREWHDRARSAGDIWGIESSLHFLGEDALHRKAYDEAARLFGERLTLARSMRDLYAVGVAQVRRAHALLALGEIHEAGRLCRESLEPLRRLGDSWWLAFCLEGLAAVAAETREYVRAATLLGAADGLRAAIGRAPSDRPDHDRASEAVGLALDPSARDEAWARGRAMTRDHAVAFGAQEDT